METKIQKFIELKDVSFTPYAVIAYGKTVIPATMQTPDFPAISIWLRDLKEPLLITYSDAEERDAEFQIVRDAVSAL